MRWSNPWVRLDLWETSSFKWEKPLALIIPAVVALGLGAVVGGTLGNIGQTISDKSPATVVRVVNIIGTTIAGASLFALIGAGIEWLYQIENLSKTLYWPAGIGAVIGLGTFRILSSPNNPCQQALSSTSSPGRS